MIARALTAPSQPRYDGDTENSIVHALSAEGHDASEDGTGRGVPLYYSHDYNQDRIYSPDGPVPAHTANDSNRARNVAVGSLVRRLTPIECERLQGFQDGHTCLCGAEADWRACSCPDSPRYRALGNAVTVNVIEWIGRRQMRVIAGSDANATYTHERAARAWPQRGNA